MALLAGRRQSCSFGVMQLKRRSEGTNWLLRSGCCWPSPDGELTLSDIQPSSGRQHRRDLSGSFQGTTDRQSGAHG